MQMGVREHRGHHPALRRAPLRIAPLARLHHPRIQPLPCRVSSRPVSPPSLRNAPRVTPLHTAAELLTVRRRLAEQSVKPRQRKMRHSLRRYRVRGAQGRWARPRSGAGGGDVARQPESEGAPGRHGSARTNGPQAIGKSRGDWSTKIHRIASDDRSAIGFSLSGGEAGDAPQGRALPKYMNLFPTRTHRPPRCGFGIALRRRVCE